MENLNSATLVKIASGAMSVDDIVEIQQRLVAQTEAARQALADAQTNLRDAIRAERDLATATLRLLARG
jgi:hypothetical protein